MWVGMFCNSSCAKHHKVNVARRGQFEDKVLDCLDRRLCVPMRLWIVKCGHNMADFPTLQESFEFLVGELGPTVRPEAYGDSQVAEDMPEVTNSGCKSRV